MIKEHGEMKTKLHTFSLEKSGTWKNFRNYLEHFNVKK
jgi:hypothetical protein